MQIKQFSSHYQFHLNQSPPPPTPPPPPPPDPRTRGARLVRKCILLVIEPKVKYQLILIKSKALHQTSKIECLAQIPTLKGTTDTHTHIHIYKCVREREITVLCLASQSPCIYQRCRASAITCDLFNFNYEGLSC